VARPKREQARLPEMLAEVAMASGVGYLAAAYTASRWLTRPSPGKPSHTPGDLGLVWEPLLCRTADHQRLVGWVVTPSQPKGTVALFHGVRNNRAQTLKRLRLLVAAGYRCVSFDHRAHGESSGRRTSFGYYEGRDVAAIVDLIRERWADEPRAALGISMGAAAVCYSAEHCRGFDAVILESLYHDIDRALSSRIQGYPPWFQRLRNGAIWVTERRLKLRMNQLAPVEYMKKFAPTPVLLVTGSNDSHAPPADLQRLYERCRGRKELWVVPDATHHDVFEKGGPAYHDLVVGFLDRHLSR